MHERNVTRFLWSAVAASLLLASAVAFAQPRGRGERGLHGRHGGPMHMLRELDLTDDQREQIRSAFEEMRTSGAHERSMEARKALHAGIESGADEATLRQLAYQVGEVEGELAVERARIHSRIQEILTAEQRQELEQLKAEARQKMEERRKRFEERRRERDPQ